MHPKERSIIAEAYSDTRHVTLFRCYRNFTHWYEIERFSMRSHDNLKDSFTSTREYYDVDQAFDSFDQDIKLFNLTILEKREA